MGTPRVGESDANRVAIVTGGSLGVGRAITRHLASHRFAVVFSYTSDQATAESVVEEVLAAQGIALAIRADVTDQLDVARLFTETIEAFGAVDVVAHAASRLTLAQDSFGVPCTQHSTDIQGAFAVAQHASRQVRPGGTIVNLCVIQHRLPTPDTRAGGNRAVGEMTRVLARALYVHDVTFNAVAYRPDDPSASAVAAVVVGFLVGPDARSVTGHILQVERGDA